MKKSPPETVFGHDIPKARITLIGWLWIAVYLGIPVVLLGSVLDAITSLLLGRCTGWWCLF